MEKKINTMHRRERSMKDTTVPQRRRTPSFSSTLLDEIYRSTDDSGTGNEPKTLRHYREKTGSNHVKKQSIGSMEGDRKGTSLKRAIMIEKWVEKQSLHGSAAHFNSTSSSSDSSNAGILSSSEAESSYKEKPRRSKPKNSSFSSDDDNKEKGKRETGGGFTKTKLKALKIYGELKKVKQPISPGGRLTTFLNSIFNANAKKVKICSDGVSGDVNFRPKSKSTASSPTSFSRSCFSKTPSNCNTNKYNNGNKRSVKFCPVPIIVDEDCRPCGHKFIYEQDPRLMSTSTVQNNLKVCSKNQGLKKKESAVRGKASDYLRGFIEDDEDDASSCSSSDLFELDHLIGIGRYREELPVYETTRLKNNQAIVNGFIV